MWSIAYLVLEWLIRLAMLPIVLRRRTPQAALSWLVIIFALPLPGLILYLLIGENRLPRRRAQRHKRVIEAIQQVERMAVVSRHVAEPEVPESFRSVLNLTRNTSDFAPVGLNSVDLLTETDQTIDRMIEDIDHAGHHVHIVMYIWRDDATGRRVAEALARAEKRGIECRVMIDAVGSRSHIGALRSYFRSHGIECLDMLRVNPLRRQFQRLDLRNHRKLVVIDGRIAYAGSQNLVNADYGRKNLVWHDLMVRITGPAALQLQTVFLQDWYAETDVSLISPDILPEPAPTPGGEAVIQVVPSGPIYPVRAFHNLVVESIYASNRRIIITTPYMIPDEPLLAALKSAALRGVRVDIVAPSRIDQRLVHAAARSYYRELLDAGVNLHLFTDGLLHSKTMTFDDSMALVGSANLDVRSFKLNFELNVLMFGPQPTARLRFIQHGYLDRSEPADPAHWAGRHWVRKTADNFARLFSPLL